MSIQPSPSGALPIAHFVLRLLIILNLLLGAGILALLIISLANEPWFMSAFKLPDSTDGHRVLIGMRAIAVLGLAAIPLHFVILKRLLAIVETVRSRDPFAEVNAYRLQTIAWVLLMLNLLSIVIGAIGSSISTKDYPLHLNAGFSVSGWLAVLLTFVLARVFAEGAVMRDDLEGTV